MTNITLKVEIGAGTSIEEAAKNTLELANKLGVIIEFRFNDFVCVSYPDGNPELMAQDYLASKSKIKGIKIVYNK